MSRTAASATPRRFATGNKRLISAVEDGDIAVSIAAKLADQDQATQDEAVANPDRAHTIVKLKTREGHEDFSPPKSGAQASR